MGEFLSQTESLTDAQELVAIFAPEECKNCDVLTGQATTAGSSKVQWQNLDDLEDVLFFERSTYKLKALARSIIFARQSCPGITPNNGTCQLEIDD